MILNGIFYPRSEGERERLAAWVAKQIPYMPGGFPQGAAALGLMARGKLVGGAVFCNQRADVDIEVSLAASSPRWCRPAVIRQLFHYPFHQLRVARVTCIVAPTNTRVRRVLEGALGFQLEGVVRKGLDGTADALIYGALRDECRWL